MLTKLFADAARVQPVTRQSVVTKKGASVAPHKKAAASEAATPVDDKAPEKSGAASSTKEPAAVDKPPPSDGALPSAGQSEMMDVGQKDPPAVVEKPAPTRPKQAGTGRGRTKSPISFNK